jgi:hypothetical protein
LFERLLAIVLNPYRTPVVMGPGSRFASPGRR